MNSVLAAPTPAAIAHAADLIRRGRVVAFPTETVYGLGANARDAQAVAQIFALKGRPHFDPLIVHVADRADIAGLAAEVPSVATELAQRFWPGPLTLVLPKQPWVPDIVTSGLPSVAVRQPDHPVALALLRAAGTPIAAPSANLFGRTSPTTADHVVEQFGSQLEMVLDGGPCRVGVESTIVSLLEATPVLLRPGGVALEDLIAAVGPVQVAVSTTSDDTLPLAPGQLASHYAPRTPLVLQTESGRFPAGKRIGLLSFRAPDRPEDWGAIETLSSSGDLCEAAANLFAAMRRLDAAGLDQIVAEPVPEVGLGRAIMDRLRRAAATTVVN